MDAALASGSRVFREHFRSGRQANPRHGSQYAFFVAGRLLRLWSVYALFSYLAGRNAPVLVFMFTCLLASGVAFLVLQRPWIGRPLSTTQIGPTILNGGVLALALVCWAKSLEYCGPVRTVFAEYAGAVVGASSTLLLGRGGHKLKKAGGLVAMLLAFYCLSKGYATASSSPVGLDSMSLAIASGALMALRRILARRVSVNSVMKRRLHSVTVAAAACFLFPFAMYQLLTREAPLETHGSATLAYLSTTLFGIILAFYVDSYAEDRLHIHANSPLHFFVTSGLLISLELLHHMDFSFVGFLICASVLGLGIFEATSATEVPLVLPTDVTMSSGPSGFAS